MAHPAIWRAAFGSLTDIEMIGKMRVASRAIPVIMATRFELLDSTGCPMLLTSLKNLPSGLFLGKHLALGILEAPVRRMLVEQGAVNAVFLQHEFLFLAQGFVDLSGDPSQQLFPRLGRSLTTQTT